jgi:hypothetical protein
MYITPNSYHHVQSVTLQLKRYNESSWVSVTVKFKDGDELTFAIHPTCKDPRDLPIWVHPDMNVLQITPEDPWDTSQPKKDT